MTLLSGAIGYGACGRRGMIDTPKRERNSRRSRSGGQREQSPTHIRRMRDNAYRQASNALLGSELGRLSLTLDDDGRPLISDVQLAAGEKYGKLRVAYLRVIGGPANAKSVALERGSHGQAPDPDSDRGHEEAERDRNTIKQMLRTDTAL